MALSYFIGMSLLSLFMFFTECVETDHQGQVLGDKTRLIRLPCFAPVRLLEEAEV